ncbi:hypothetical protein MNBD_BACTEROID03-177, partial [hydrothermal vent metagenome]
RLMKNSAAGNTGLFMATRTLITTLVLSPEEGTTTIRTLETSWPSKYGQDNRCSPVRNRTSAQTPFDSQDNAYNKDTYLREINGYPINIILTKLGLDCARPDNGNQFYW